MLKYSIGSIINERKSLPLLLLLLPRPPPPPQPRFQEQPRQRPPQPGPPGAAPPAGEEAARARAPGWRRHANTDSKGARQCYLCAPRPLSRPRNMFQAGRVKVGAPFPRYRALPSSAPRRSRRWFMQTQYLAGREDPHGLALLESLALHLLHHAESLGEQGLRRGAPSLLCGT